MTFRIKFYRHLKISGLYKMILMYFIQGKFLENIAYQNYSGTSGAVQFPSRQHFQLQLKDFIGSQALEPNMTHSSWSL